MPWHQKIILFFFPLCIIWSFIGTVSIGNWVLEISPVLVALPIVFYLDYKHRIRLSNFSYFCVYLYLLFPIVQAHYGVAMVPSGFALGEWLGVHRNMFDRATHFLFGLLLMLPLLEIFDYVPTKKAFLKYYLALSTILAFSAIYEILEWIVNVSASSRLSFLFVAAQEDFWDSSKDMAMAAIGALIALFIILLVRRNKGARG